MNISDKIKGGIIGVAVGDALGVPFEFLTKEQMQDNPATNMVGYGSHHQPLGTWSDDSSLTFCLMEGLLEGYNTKTIANKFIDWCDHNYWTPHGDVFDIGVTTRQAIFYMKQGHTPEICGGMDEYSNGNGSLMRILPIVFYLQNENDIQKRFQITKDISSLTHAHIRAVLACFIYVEYCLELLKKTDKIKAYKAMQLTVNEFLETSDINTKEINFYYSILQEDIYKTDKERISGSGYVVNSLKASLWCFINTTTYKEAVLTAINLGQDTDTTAAITGGLAGLYYGNHKIPKKWKHQLVNYEKIEDLIARFTKIIQS
ncbi:ADP-ribosylglycohydrolase family protein [uncultured Dokdonia sp.]|uniref:ADP-ribosylglycohydrolase family protein n=1 Tax=uncultured Dokdonia sp. TaxID=575653 RepID=UPI0026347B65|nr:ADP-ribosylglycohydrolase family protein [uncultured Dokdonia sp.]